MTAVRSRNGSFKVFATMAMVLVMALLSACDVLATEGARDAIANGREIREFEDANLRPLEREMEDLWVNEIEPRERQLEELYREQQTLQEDLLQPLWDAQNDPWAPGGAAAILQEEFEEKNRQIDVLYRQIELEQRELDQNWQTLWSAGSVDPLFQELEDLRYEKQRELDRLYRFGNRPIDDIWDQINELNNSQGFANTDSQIEAEQINVELRRLWDLQNEIQNGANDEVNALYEKANNAQNELNDLHNFGWNPINDIYAEIDRLQFEQSSTGFDAAGVPISTDSISAQIAELQSTINSHIASRDSKVAIWEAQLAALNTDSTESTVTTSTSDRIVELQGLIADLESDIDALIASINADIDSLSDQIEAKKDSYNQLIEDAESDFLTLSGTLLADAAAVQAEIDALEAAGGDDAAAQIAELQTQYDALIASEENEEAALHTLIAGYESDRDTGVDELNAEKEVVEAKLLNNPTADLDAKKADYEAELSKLLSADGTTAGGGSTAGTLSAADIQANIDAENAHWNGLIEELKIKIAALENQLLIGSASSEVDTRINSLRLQAQELETQLLAKIQSMEQLVAELYRQADSFNQNDSAQAQEIQRQIDELNKKLEAIWAEDSSNNLQIMIQVQALQKQAFALEEEREDEQYRLEEELWDLDDQISRFHKDQNSGTSAKEAEYQAIADDLQQRRFLLDEQRWTLNDEQQLAWDAFDVAQTQANEEIKKIEEEQFGAIREKIRAIEDELQTFYNMQRDLEVQIREAQRLVEEKKRELEDKVFDALESAAGTVDEAGETVLTATEESGDPTATVEADAAGSTEPATSADGTAN